MDYPLKPVRMIVSITALVLCIQPVGLGQEKIRGHLGVNLGMRMAELKEALTTNPCVSKTKTSEILFEQVPLKSYYRSYCRHNPRFHSEVAFWVDAQTGVVQIRESFNGEAISNLADTRREFARLKGELSMTWGSPNRDAEDLAVWRDTSHAAVLRVIPPDHPLSLPILKVVVSAHGLTSEEMQKTLAGKVF
jgi:hypothetical protein